MPYGEQRGNWSRWSARARCVPTTESPQHRAALPHALVVCSHSHPYEVARAGACAGVTYSCQSTSANASACSVWGASRASDSLLRSKRDASHCPARSLLSARGGDRMSPYGARSYVWEEGLPHADRMQHSVHVRGLTCVCTRRVYPAEEPPKYGWLSASS